MLPLKKTFLASLLFGFLPVLFFVAIGFFYTSQIKYFIKEIVEFFLFSSVVYALGIVLFRGVLRFYWGYFSIVFLFLISFFKASFYYLYQSKLTISAFYILFETTEAESSQFLATFFDFNLLLITLGYLLFLVLALRQLRSLFRKERNLFYFPKLNLKGGVVFLILISSIFSSIYLINWKLKHNNIIFLAKDAYISYQEAQELFKTNLVTHTNVNIKDVTTLETPQTYVVIIGESTSSRNMGLYGYFRNTNPLLSEIKDELLIFKDVIAPHTHTIPSLNKVLSLSNYENPEVIDCGSVVQLANAAGFSTFWISNQQPIGIHETLVTAISKATKKQFFTNALTNKQVEYDEELLPYIKEVLDKKDAKKILFIHLYGTHISYKHTYPPNFQKFTDTPITKFPSARSKEQINHYDNAILYNDFIVKSIINQVKKRDENAYVIYFSDHGDEVFQDIDFVGHSEYHSTKPMHEIPFIVWTSEKFRQSYPNFDTLKSYENRRYMLDDFIHSFSDLSQINFNQFHPERSIFNKKFKERKRIIINRVDYDNR